MKKLFLTFTLAAICSLCISAKGEYDPQLQQLTKEIASYVVGTPDETFESCTFEDGMITFVVNPESNVGKAKLADPFAENFYETVVAKMLSGNLSQGYMILDFMQAAGSNFCFKIMVPGAGYSEATVFPGNVKPILSEISQATSQE